MGPSWGCARARPAERLLGGVGSSGVGQGLGGDGVERPLPGCVEFVSRLAEQVDHAQFQLGQLRLRFPPTRSADLCKPL